MTEAEFRDVFHSYKQVVYRFAYRMTGSGSAAEDLVQECFIALWKKPYAYKSERGEIRPYLLGITRKLVLKRWKGEHRYGSDELDSLVCLPFDMVRIERSEAIAAAVQSLPPLQREAVVLAEYEELSLEDISRITEADLAAVKSRLHRARQNLRRMLAPFLDTKNNLEGMPNGTPK